ncbi:MAG TPA: fructose-2,6-bisphosphatase, partial [Polyangiaceae bacterium]|nr:fructose-2,6-bisphosphatase [Polyangiaceae bacterium]
MQTQQDKTVLAMVGLPARGKSFTARKIARYLTWRGHHTRVFNVGSYRREQLGAKKEHSFFDPDNREARQARRKVALDALDDAIRWLKEDNGEVAVFDATNTTRSRRQDLRAACDAAGVKITFVETICEDPAIIEDNIRATKLHLPDYEDLDDGEALRDFRMRIAHYRRIYEPLENESASWIKLIVFEGGGRRIVVNRVDDHPTLRAAQLLLSFQSRERTIWLARHGESTHNVAGRIGGDAPLSDEGKRFAQALGEWMKDKGDFKVWTSTLVRTRQTAELVAADHTPWRMLDEIDAGICDGMTYEEIGEQMPEVATGRKADKLRYRYPRGESYLDVINRLDPLIGELERLTHPLLVIGHQAVLRTLYAYLTGHPREETPFLEIP